MYRNLIGFAVIIMIGAAILAFSGRHVLNAQELATATPVRANLPQLPPPTLEFQDATATPTRTPTPVGPVQLQAKAEAGNVNVRAEPDINAELLGTIRAGESYPVLGRYFRWIQFQFDGAPTGTVRAWVFDELVDLTGDVSAIPNLDPDALPTQDPVQLTATAIQQQIDTTPGAVLTVTAASRNLSLSGALVGGVEQQPPPGNMDLNPVEEVILPTFTYPPDIVAVAPTQPPLELEPTNSPSFSIIEVTGMPPIVPILALGGLGLLGLLVSSLRS